MNMQSNKIEKEAKMDQESTGLITVDGVEYKFSDMTDAAKAQLSNIQFVDHQVRQLQNEWAVSDTARLGYQAALKGELLKSPKKLKPITSCRRKSKLMVLNTTWIALA